MISIALLSLAIAHDPLSAQFDSIEEFLPSPNQIRTASGRPGNAYWQQQADYQIQVSLDEKAQNITGAQTITYHNNSPDALPYLWLQLDANQLSNQSERERMRAAPHLGSVSVDSMRSIDLRPDYDPDLQIWNVRAEDGSVLPFVIDSTLMRINLPTPLEPNSSYSFSMEWSYTLNNSDVLWARSGYEYFPSEDNSIYEIAQFYPRMAIYTDVDGWLTKEYLGSGEFATEFGNFEVEITVPADHVVGATGQLQNPEQVLTAEQRKRFEKAKTAAEPIFIVTPKEASQNEKEKQSRTKTWIFKADNVRDFAFGSSRKFIWDAWGREIAGQTVMAMSYYPNEAEPLWSQYSTQAVAHTLEVYSEYLFPYPYPVCISMNGAIGGMEYPMLSFNGPRPLEDETYFGDDGPWRHKKYGLISVIIHEVGHNWFPMMINTDERSWTWMDEGLNTYVQMIAQAQWEEDYPLWRGEPQNITQYMSGSNEVPIMTDADSLRSKGNNAYAKPATAMNILRETIIGAENFDFAFQQYAQAWAFKRPYPADFFRIIEDAAGKDLDWFWRAWFYSTNHVDLSISKIQTYRKLTGNPEIDKPIRREQEEAQDIRTKTELRYQDSPKRATEFPSLLDFYNEYDPYEVTDADIEQYDELLKEWSEEERQLRQSDRYYHVITIENITQMPTPVIMRITYQDGTQEEYRMPVHVWRKNNKKTTKLIQSEQPLYKVELDPFRETADADLSNNQFPPVIQEKLFEVVPNTTPPQNPMQKARKAAEKEE